MEIISVNAERKIKDLASSIGHSPESWRSWSCVYVPLNNINETVQQDCLFWIKSFVESYLKRAEGAVYFCANNSIHILCKNVQIDVLKQTGEEICNLIHAESSVCVHYKLYSFVNDAMMYALDILEKPGHLFQSILVDERAAHNKLKLQNASRNETSASTPKVMLVEDDPVTRWIVRNTLKNECDLITAATASKVFLQYKTYQPDVVFLDIDLPDHNGYDVLQWVMRNDPAACVVMFSSNDYLENIVKATENGARGFIGKPFVKEQMLNYIQ